MAEYKSDIEIAQEAQMLPISEVAAAHDADLRKVHRNSQFRIKIQTQEKNPRIQEIFMLPMQEVVEHVELKSESAHTAAVFLKGTDQQIDRRIIAVEVPPAAVVIVKQRRIREIAVRHPEHPMNMVIRVNDFPRRPHVRQTCLRLVHTIPEKNFVAVTLRDLRHTAVIVRGKANHSTNLA